MDTPYFYCDHTEWRIQWSFTPDPKKPTNSSLAMYAFYSNGTMLTFISSGSDSATAGVSDIHNNKGTFYLSIFVGYLLNYSIIIQQDIDSVPEVSPIIFLFVLTTGILVATKLSHAELKKRHKRLFSLPIEARTPTFSSG
jgi:hypothetical protein